MDDSSEGELFILKNLHQGHRYIKKGAMIFPCPASTTPDDLYPNEQIITLLGKQSGRLVIQYNFVLVVKSGRGVRPAEAEALRLVSHYTSVSAPELFLSSFSPDFGSIRMSLIPGCLLEEKWDKLDGAKKEFVCRQTWDLISKIRDIPRPEKLQNGPYQCNADGSLSKDPMLADLDPQSPKALMNDHDVRNRIYERYLHFGGRRYEGKLLDMLPLSEASVFTHADIAPRNIMVDEQNVITGILDWEYAGWYPDYWEYAQIFRPAVKCKDFSVWMDQTAPRRWDLTGKLAFAL